MMMMMTWLRGVGKC